MRSLSVVLSVGDNASVAEQLVRYLLAARVEGAVREVIAVHDGSRRRVAERLIPLRGDLRLVTTSLPGTAAAWNQGAAEACGDDLLFLDGDCLPVGAPLDELRVYGDSHPEAVVIGSRIIAADDRIWHAGVVIGQDDRPHSLYAGFSAFHPAVRRSRELQVTLLDGARVRREAFVAGDGLDPVLSADWSAADFCRRVAAAGAAIHVCHDATWWLPFERPPPFQGDASVASEAMRAKGRVPLERDDLRHYVDDGLLGERYPGPHPSRLAISSALASIDRATHRQSAGRLLDRGAEEIRELVRANDRLRERIRRGGEP